MTNELDVTKPCVTKREKWPAEHLSVVHDSDGRPSHRIWLVTPEAKHQYVMETHLSGRPTIGSDSIINAPQTRNVWHFVYRTGGDLYIHATEYGDKKPTWTPKDFVDFPGKLIGWQGPFVISGQPTEGDG